MLVLSTALFTFLSSVGPVEAFSNESNCENKDAMEVLQRSPLRCAEVAQGSDSEQIEECMAQLGRQLFQTCPYTDIQVGSSSSLQQPRRIQELG